MNQSSGSIVCAVIGRTRHKMMQIEIQEAAKRGAKLLELRLDFLAKPPDFKRLLADKPCPMIATVRRPADGGRWGGTEEERFVLLRQAIVAGFDWVDLETDIAHAIPRYGKVKRIVSYHNMREMPANLEEIHKKMCGQDADVVKIAVTAHAPQDNLRVLALMESSPKPTIAFCMGDLGVCSRILAARLGAPFAYSAFNKQRNVAPGILSFEDLENLYRYDKITAATPVFGVIGDPVGHSLSPLVHNRAFAELGIDGTYLPFRVPRGDLEEFVNSYESVPVRGYSVTIPHKEAAAQLADVRDEIVERTGAANTLIRGDKGWHAYNTDAQAAIDSLEAHLPPSQSGEMVPMSSRSVLIVGAGGVARAVAHAVQRTGAVVSITNRTPERSHKLAEEVGCKMVDWAARHNVICDTLINCTSVGMHPNLDESPIHASFLKPGLTVFDTIYTPETTLLLREALARGCHVITGVDMFVRQAGLQFRLFTGQEPPLAVMSRAVRRALSPVHLNEEDEV